MHKKPVFCGDCFLGEFGIGRFNFIEVLFDEFDAIAFTNEKETKQKKWRHISREKETEHTFPGAFCGLLFRVPFCVGFGRAR